MVSTGSTTGERRGDLGVRHARRHDGPVSSPVDRLPYRLRMPDGVIVGLDLPVVVGRRPRAVRSTGDRRVRLVSVASGDTSISATHLELRRIHDAIVVTDMRSTNGSVVTVPGSLPRTLFRGQTMVVTPGTVIDLGAGTVVEVLSPDLTALYAGATA